MRSACRMAPAAYWASWADALPMLQDRLPAIAQLVSDQLESDETEGCVGFLQHAAEALDRSGFVADLHGNNCEREFVLRLTRSLRLASGSMAGNTTRLPLSNTTFGRPWLLPSRLLRAVPTCDLIQDQEPVQFCAVHRQDRSAAARGVQNSCARAFAIATPDHRVPLRVWGVS